MRTAFGTSSSGLPTFEVLILAGFCRTTSLTNLGEQRLNTVDPENMSWAEAGRLLMRTERYLRLLRRVALGPAAKPPRLVIIPAGVLAQYEAQGHNPRWGPIALASSGRGARCCVQLWHWLEATVALQARQRAFLSLLSATFPEWTPVFTELSFEEQRVKMQIAILATASKCIQKALNEERSQIVIGVLSDELSRLATESEGYIAELEEIIGRRLGLFDVQAQREATALLEVCTAGAGLEEEDSALRTELAQMDVEACLRAQEDWRLAALRRRVNNVRSKLAANQERHIVLRNQLQINEHLRKTSIKITARLCMLTKAIGENRFASVLLRARMETLVSAVRRADLPQDKAGAFSALEEELATLRAEGERLALKLVTELSAVANEWATGMRAYEEKCAACCRKFEPSVRELEENRREVSQKSNIRSRIVTLAELV
jgi:hypothetical protein